MQNKEFILDIKRLGINGEGIGYYNRKAVFVKNAIPGEGINVRIVKEMPKMDIAEIVEFKKVSKDRVEPACKYYERCGACQTMHIKYQRTLELKRDLVIEAIRRYTKLNPLSFEIKKTIASDEIFNYRNKASLIVRSDKGILTTAMIEEGTNKSFAVDKCKIEDSLIHEVNSKILKLGTELKVKAYPNEDFSLRYIVTRVTKTTRKSLVCLVVKEFNEEIKNFSYSIVAKNLCDSLYVNVNPDLKTNEIIKGESLFIGGEKYIVEEIGKYKFKLFPSTFFQLNTKQTEKLYEETKKACKLSHQERVLDAYCGIGTISLYISNLAKEVVGIEYNKESVKAANENAKINKIKNVTFKQGDTAKVYKELIKDGHFDVLVFDPPRTGLTKELIDMILDSNARRIVYVSCNPSTLAKDLDFLTTKYQIRYIQPIDMFPNTSHVESITLLDLKK